jgi:hypothetical protein
MNSNSEAPLRPTVSDLVRRPSAYLPLVLSAVALALIAGYVALFGVVGRADGDEGAAARIFQLLMAAELAIILVFSATWIPRAPKAALGVLALQLCAAAVPIATILILES